MIAWPTYRARIQESYAAISAKALKDGATECAGGLLLKSTNFSLPNQAPWRTDWAVVFTDGNYFRVKESYKKAPGSRAPFAGEREHLSFHYGKAHKDFDGKGFPKSDPRDNPPHAELRIDIDQHLSPHIHHRSAEHIKQDRIEGFQIADADLFEFVRAVLDHRENHKPLLSLLKIQILP